MQAGSIAGSKRAASRELSGSGIANPLCAPAVWALLALAAFAMFEGAGINQDSSWFLVATGRWLDGEALYSGVMEINPPLIFYLTAPVVWAHRVLGIDVGSAFHLFLAGLAFCSATLVRSVMRTAADVTRAEAMLFPAAALALLIFGPLPQVGQREHLAVIFSLPYLTLVAYPAARPRRGIARVLVAAFASLGLLLKPHFLLAPLCALAMACWFDRSLRRILAAEHVTLAALSIGYLFAIAKLHPDYVAIVVPLARATYGGYDASPADMLSPDVWLVPALGLALALAARARLVDLRPPGVLIAAAAGALVAYFVQGKGWDYQLIPATIYGSLAGVAFAGAALRRREALALAAMACMLAAFVLATHVAGGTFSRPQFTALKGEIGDVIKGQTFVALNSGLHQNFPFVNETGAIWSSRFPSLWPVPGALKRLESEDLVERQAGVAAVEAVRRMVAEDFARFQPRYVLVPDPGRDRFVPAGFDYVAFLSKSPAFAAEWGSYRKARDLPGHTLWERRDAPRPSTR